jgi:hypothetical protein
MAGEAIRKIAIDSEATLTNWFTDGSPVLREVQLMSRQTPNPRQRQVLVRVQRHANEQSRQKREDIRLNERH